MNASVARPVRAAGAAEAACATCRYFQVDPLTIERLVPGLRSFGSGFASVRSEDGLCLRHARYLPAAACCGDHEIKD